MPIVIIHDQQIKDKGYTQTVYPLSHTWHITAVFYWLVIESDWADALQNFQALYDRDWKNQSAAASLRHSSEDDVDFKA